MAKKPIQYWYYDFAIELKKAYPPRLASSSSFSFPSSISNLEIIEVIKREAPKIDNWIDAYQYPPCLINKKIQDFRVPDKIWKFQSSN